MSSNIQDDGGPGGGIRSASLGIAGTFGEEDGPRGSGDGTRRKEGVGTEDDEEDGREGVEDKPATPNRGAGTVLISLFSTPNTGSEASGGGLAATVGGTGVEREAGVDRPSGIGGVDSPAEASIGLGMGLLVWGLVLLLLLLLPPLCGWLAFGPESSAAGFPRSSGCRSVSPVPNELDTWGVLLLPLLRVLLPLAAVPVATLGVVL